VKASAEEWTATIEMIGWNSLVISNGEAHQVQDQGAAASNEVRENLCDDIYDIKQKRCKILHDFFAHCGDKEMGGVQIDNVKAQELHENLYDDDLSINDIPDSQESCIIEILEHERMLKTLKNSTPLPRPR
jgi:hypothetical protein